MNTCQQRYATVDSREMLRTYGALYLLGAFSMALFAPAILQLSWWSAPWIFLGLVAFSGVQFLRPFETLWGPVVTLDDRGITVNKWLDGEWTLAWSEYAGYRDEEGWPWKWGRPLFTLDEYRTLVILSRRHGLYGRVLVKFPCGSGKENYRRLLEALDRRAPYNAAL